MSNEKYNMFKNFLHNELGISREDIREWIKEAVADEARKIIKKTFDDFDVQSEARREMRNMISSRYSEVYKDIIEGAVKVMLSEFTITVKQKDK